VEKERRRNFFHRRRSPRDCKLPGHVFHLRLVIRTRQETDKATIDVEAQDDGIIAKIIVRPLVFVFF
jgi:hypothetical protein